MKKYVISGLILIIFIFTNPSSKDLMYYLRAKLPSPKTEINILPRLNVLLFTIYDIKVGSHYDYTKVKYDYSMVYLTILGNYFEISTGFNPKHNYRYDRAN